MRFAAILIAALGFAACGSDQTVTYHNALTGASCSPDMTTFVKTGTKGSKHAGCDANHCCEVHDGECHPDGGTPDATEIPNPP